jgi:hypothetical protein
MDIKEYKQKSLKNRTKHIKLPSGLEFDVVLPTPYQLVFGIADVKNETESSKKLLEMVKLPDGLALDDFETDDLVSFMEQITDFFTKGTKSLSGFKTTQSK